MLTGGNPVNAVVSRLKPTIHFLDLVLLQSNNSATFRDIRNSTALRHGRLKMDRNTESRSLFGAIATGLSLLIVAAICFFVLQSMTTGGTASLPNGVTAVINGPFFCSEIPPMTKIEAGGRTFTFSPTTVSVDGVPVGPLDATVTTVQIDAGYWAASLFVNGKEVKMAR